MNFRQLILRANRFLGVALVDKELIDEHQLEQASERLLETFSETPVRRPLLLEILVYEMRVLPEDEYLGALARGTPIGLIDLSRVAIENVEGIGADECQATNTIVFDRMEDHYFLATTYYPSAPVREYWQDRLSGPIQWFACPIASMNEYLEAMVSELPAAMEPVAVS